MGSRIVVVRHGETEWSASGRHTSRTDLSLTDEGRRAAQALAPRLSEFSFSVVLTSPLRRARETCELAGLGAVAEVEDDLREWDYGEYEGLTTSEIRGKRPSWWLWRDGCPSGESPEQVAARADRVLARVAEVEGDVAVFAHGHLLRALTARYLGMEVAAGARFYLSAGTLSTLGYERETEALLLWNA